MILLFVFFYLFTLFCLPPLYLICKFHFWFWSSIGFLLLVVKWLYLWQIWQVGHMIEEVSNLLMSTFQMTLSRVTVTIWQLWQMTYCQTFQFQFVVHLLHAFLTFCRYLRLSICPLCRGKFGFLVRYDIFDICWHFSCKFKCKKHQTQRKKLPSLWTIS